MVSYNCLCCHYITPNKYNYTKHLHTKKHLLIFNQKKQQNEENEGKNEENEEKVASITTKQNLQKFLGVQNVPQNICQYCSKVFSRNDNLKRHISVCKLNISVTSIQKYPEVSKKEEKSCKNNEFECQFCFNKYKSNRGLSKHIKKCWMGKKKMNDQDRKINQLQTSFETKLLETKYQGHIQTQNAIIEHQQKTIDTVQKMKPSVTYITNNSNNKTINYLNSNYGEMIAMDKFLHNLQHTEQLTQEERQHLLMSYKDSGIELFARSFSHIMKENCRRQLLKEGLPEMDIIPLYCSDGNLRSHKEKDDQGWKTHYDDNSLNTMINISSQQVYQSCQKPLMIFGKERNKVFKQIKQDNHSQKKKENKLVEDQKD